MKCNGILLFTVFFKIIVLINADANLATSEAVLDPRGSMLLHWIVDYNTNKITFTIYLNENVKPLNWFAIGFSDRGEFVNADLCMFWVDFRGNEHYKDTYTDENGIVKNDLNQNCDNFNLNESKRTVSFQRLFDTCDHNDYLIDEGTTHVIWAHGRDTLYSSEGLRLLEDDKIDRGFIRVRLLTPHPLPPPKAQQFRILNKNLKVPNKDTTYWCRVQKLPKFISDRKHHIVQYHSLITPGNEGLVHHMEVFHCDLPPHTEVPLYSGDCFSKHRPEITKSCSKVKAAWAMGAPPFTYPLEAGLSLGGRLENKYIMLEVHYNNPEMKNDWVDSSGIVLYVTANLRKYDAAIIELGLEYTDKMAIPPGVEDFILDGYCIPECTSVGLPHDGIVVFGSQLHTHLTGVKVWTRHYRNGKELPLLNYDMHYSTHFQEIRILHQPRHVLPGDSLITSCVYQTMDRKNATIGGHAITDEMCVNYMHYYPMSQLEVCKSSVSTKKLKDYFRFESSWDAMSIEIDVSARANYLAINPWSPLRIDALKTLYHSAPISMQCNKSDGTRFQGNWEDMTVEYKPTKIPEIERNCRKEFNQV